MVLLITSSIFSSAPYTLINDSDTRLNQLLNSIIKWVTEYPEIKIVVCDGSGFDFQECNLCKELYRMNQRLEFISFNNSYELVKILGKGFGEGEIIEYAIKNSSFIHECDSFAKVTGRLFVKNVKKYFTSKKINLYCQLNFSFKFIFLPIKCNSFDTRFYVIDKELYVKHFMKLYQEVNDNKGIFLEHVFLKKVKELHGKHEDIKFWNYFEVIGVSGSTGKIYRSFNFLKLVVYEIRNILIYLLFNLRGSRYF